jgi:hypothetical protein
MGRRQPLLAFVHIPRTGGGTLSWAISKNYSPQKGPGNYQKGPEKTRQGVENIAANSRLWQAVGDHVPYGLYLRYLPADTRYITILRDPIDRVLSHYHFHAQAGDPPGEGGPRKLKRIWEELLSHERIEREGGQEDGENIVLPDDTEFSLEEGLRRKICIYDNFMTRFLWGGESLYGELPPDALERAKQNIAAFWFVGVRERLDESIILLGQKLGVGLMPYYLRHVSQRRPPLGETAADMRELIAEHNALDVELYKFARELFEEAAPAPGELAEEVEELRRRSAQVTEDAEAARIVKKEEGKARRRAERAEQATQRRAKRLANRSHPSEGERPKAERRAARAVTDRGGLASTDGPETGAQAGPRVAKPRTKGKPRRFRQSPDAGGGVP